MKKTTLAVLVAGLFASGAAAQQAEFTGSVSVTGIGSHVKGQNPFVFEKYRDLSDGFTAGTDLWRRDEGGDLPITNFNFVLRPTTNVSTAQYADKNGDNCSMAGAGPVGPVSLTGAAAAGPSPFPMGP